MLADTRHGTLDGLTIAVTRPAHQADNLCRTIEAEGGHVLRFPVIDILPPADIAPLQARLQNLADYQLGIFISTNAVHQTYRALAGQLLPDGLLRAAVGQATAQALAAHGQPAHILPASPYNSEALLALPELQSLEGKRVIIFRGNHGRMLLADTLSERGAKVDHAEVYRRVASGSDPKPLYRAWDEGKLDMIIITSNEGLRNLLARVDAGYRGHLLETVLVVISERSATLARELGFMRPAIVARAASDAALLEAAKCYTQESR